jgi:hypothetical protein
MGGLSAGSSLAGGESPSPVEDVTIPRSPESGAGRRDDRDFNTATVPGEAGTVNRRDIARRNRPTSYYFSFAATK